MTVITFLSNNNNVYAIFILLSFSLNFIIRIVMNKSLITPRFLVIISVIAGAAFLRLIPHWPNFTPIAGIALFGGTYLVRKQLAFIIPFAAMLLSDLLLGFHQTMLAVYTSFALIVGIVSMGIVGCVMNYYVILPFYTKFMPIDEIIKLGTVVNPKITDLKTLILWGILPFNLFKGIVISIFTILIYKKLSPILHSNG